MSLHRIIIDSKKTAATFQNFIKAATSERQMLIGISKYFEALAGGAVSDKMRLNSGGTAAVNAITVASQQANDTITVNGVVFTAIANAGTPTSIQYRIGATPTDEQCSNNLRAAINANTTAKVVGEVYATKRGTLALSSTIATDTVTINGVAFTCIALANHTVGTNTEFVLGSSDTITADNLVAAVKLMANVDRRLAGLVSISNTTGTITINYDGALTLAQTGSTVTVANAIVVLTGLSGSTAGNLMTLAISARGSVTGANFAGGANGTLYTYLKI